MKFKKELGYTLINVKTGLFPDFNGYESNGFSSWKGVDGPKEVISELKCYSMKYNNIQSRKVKKNLKNYRVAKLIVECQK